MDATASRASSATKLRSGEIVRWKTSWIDARFSPFTGREKAAVSAGRSTTPRARKGTWGRIDRTATGTSLGSASRSHDGKTTPACAESKSQERMPGELGCQTDVSPRLESAWGAVKRAMHPFARPAKAGWACGGRRKTVVQQRIDFRSTSTERSAVGVRFDGVGGRRRSHAPPAVWSRSRKRLGRRQDAEARGRTRAGSSGRTRSSRETSLERVDARRVKTLRDRDEWVRRASISWCRSRGRGLTVQGPALCMRAIRWKASRCEAVGSNPASGARIWRPRLAVHPQG